MKSVIETDNLLEKVIEAFSLSGEVIERSPSDHVEPEKVLKIAHLSGLPGFCVLGHFQNSLR